MNLAGRAVTPLFATGRCGDAGRVVAFSECALLFARELEAFSQQNDEVTLHLKRQKGSGKRSKPSGW